MKIGGAIWTGESRSPAEGALRHAGWELTSAYLVAAQTGRELLSLRSANAEQPALDAAESRYRSALQLLDRVRANLSQAVPDNNAGPARLLR